MEFSSDAKQQVQQHLRYGDRLAAIKYLCDTYKISINEAKILVEAAEKEMEARGGTPQPESVTDDVRTRVTDLLLKGKKIDAVNLVRKAYNVRLREAVARVEAVEKEINPNFKSVQAGGCRKGAVRLFGFVFLVPGLLILGAAVLTYLGNSETIENGTTVPGTVVEMMYNDGAAAPVVSYQWNGEEKTYRSSLYSNPPSFETGEQVNIIINNADPSEILIDSFSERWLGIIIMVVLGGIFALVGLGIIYATR